MSNTFSLAWSNSPVFSSFDSELIESAAGEDTNFVFSPDAATGSVNVSAWTIEFNIAPYGYSNPILTIPSGSIAKGATGAISLSTLKADTLSFPEREYYYELIRTDSGNRKILRFGRWKVRGSPSLYPAVVIPPVKIPVLKGGTGSDLSTTGPGLLYQATVGAVVSIIQTDPADTTHVLRKDGTWVLQTGGGDALRSGNLSQFAPGGAILPASVNAEVYLSRYATAGAGTSVSPYTGWDTAIPRAARTKYIGEGGVYYAFSTWPNLNFDGVEIDAPESWFKHTGTGDGIFFDGSAATNGQLLGIKFAGKVQGNSATTKAFRAKKVHHSSIWLTVRDCTLAGYYQEFGVCNDLWLKISSNDNVGAFTYIPTYGAYLTWDGTNQSSACDIHNPKIEGLTGATGIVFDRCLNSNVWGGTSESNNIGVAFTVNSNHNYLYGTDLEGNATADITNAGGDNGCVGVTCDGLVIVTGSRNQFDKCGLNSVSTTVGANNSYTNCTIRSGVGSTWTNTATQTSIERVYDFQTGVYLDNIIYGKFAIGGAATAHFVFASAFGSIQWGYNSTPVAFLDTDVEVHRKVDGTEVARFTGGDFGLGTATPQARMEITKTTEQLRLSYDASHRISHTVNSVGSVGIVSNSGGNIGIGVAVGSTAAMVHLGGNGNAQIMMGYGGGSLSFLDQNDLRIRAIDGTPLVTITVSTATFAVPVAIPYTSTINDVANTKSLSFVLGFGNGVAGTATVPTVGDTFVMAAFAQTLINKRITRRVTTTNAPGATPSLNSDSMDVAVFTGLATAITSMSSSLSGTPVNGDRLEISFTDNGTARAITWGTSFASTTVALPTTTVISTRLRVFLEYSTVTSKWECTGVA